MQADFLTNTGVCSMFLAYAEVPWHNCRAIKVPGFVVN